MGATRKSVIQLVHTLSYGDAISGEVLALQRVFESMGIDARVCALHVHPRYTEPRFRESRLRDRITALADAHGRVDSRGLAGISDDFDGELILHYSLGSPLNDLYRSAQAACRSLVYHNLTPASWFRQVNPRIVENLEQGGRELPELCGLSDRIIADSNFNAGEIRALGFDAQVLELPIDPHRWEEGANPGIASMLRADGNFHILHVGRLAPNKCVEDIIKIFHFLHYHIEPRTRLWLVGIDIDTELYSFEIKRLARELEVDAVVNFTGGLADSEVRAMYEGASAYVCMSEHEGFCLPLIEAMHFGVPVVAFASSAVPDTVGQGGILVREKRHAEIAELIGLILHDTEMREGLIAAGHARVREMNFERFSSEVRSLFGSDVVQVAPQSLHMAAGIGSKKP